MDPVATTLVIVAPASFRAADSRPSTSALVARKDAGITGPAQLRGKTVAVNSLRSLDYLIAAEYLSRGGLSSRDVTWQELSYPHMMPALDNARVDAAFEGGVRVAQGMLPAVSFPTAFALATSRLTSESALAAPAAAKREANASARVTAGRRSPVFAESIDACERDPQKMRDAVVKHTGIKPALARQIGLPVLRPTLRAADLLPLMELARRHGLLVRDVDIERLLAPGATR